MVSGGSLVSKETISVPSGNQSVEIGQDVNSDGITDETESIYFQTNVGSNGLSDGEAHHTSWVNADDGILVFQPNAAVPVTDITQTFSEFFGGKSYANGFAALQSLVGTDPSTGKPYTTFSAATAATDPGTGASYWGEVKVWRDTNQDGVAQPGELQTLASLGIASIGLAGSANTGEQIQGSYVTSRASYTRTHCCCKPAVAKSSCRAAGTA